jgi:hypothetical protein
MLTRSRASLLVLALISAFLVFPEIAGSARAACASQHLTALLAGFEGGGNPSSFYLATESPSETPASFRIEVEIDGCTATGPDPATVNWSTTGVTATAGSDYQSTNGPSNNLNDPPCGPESHCQRTRTVNVPILNNDQPEGVSETVRIGISTNSGRVLPPEELPLHIVDDDGAARVAFAEPLAGQPYRQLEHFTTARIPVLRAGPVTGSTQVSYTLSGGSGNDVSPASGTITFAQGERLKFLTFTVNNDGAPEPAETITATLSGPGVVTPATATFTILDNDNDFQAPVTRFHHPRNGLRYRYNDFRIREMHTFYSDPGGSGVVNAWIALRRQRLNGSCSWYGEGGWVRGACGAKRWVNMKFSQPGELYFIRPGPLSPSIGTKIKKYTAWTRAEDGAGNLETSFQTGRNLSTFEVKRR